VSSFDNLGSRHAEFSDSLLFRSGGNTAKNKGKIPPVKATLPSTNRGVSRQEDREKQKGKSKIWDAVEIMPRESLFKPQIAFRESSKTPGVIELELPAVNDISISLFGEKKRKKRTIRRVKNSFDQEVKAHLQKSPRRQVSNVSEISIRTKENVEERVYSDPERKVPTYMFASMSFVSFCIAAQHVDNMFGELPSAMGDPGIATEMERAIESVLMFEVFEEAAVMSGVSAQTVSEVQPETLPSFYRMPDDIGPVGVAALALLSLSFLEGSKDDD
jgi:hypothetical protein